MFKKSKKRDKLNYYYDCLHLIAYDKAEKHAVVLGTGEIEDFIVQTWLAFITQGFNKITLKDEFGTSLTFSKNQNIYFMYDRWIAERKRNYYLKNFEQLVESLNKLPYADFSSPQTSMEQAMIFAKQFMAILTKCEKLTLDEQQQKNVSDILKQKGACKFNQVDKKFLAPKINIKQSPYEKNVQFPIFILNFLIDSTIDEFNKAFNKLTAGGSSSWCSIWLKAQLLGKTDKHFEK